MGDGGTQFREWCVARGRPAPSDAAVAALDGDARKGAYYLRTSEPSMWVSFSTYLTGRGRMATKKVVKGVDVHTTNARLRATTRGKHV